MMLRYLFAGLALSVALLVTGCSSCGHRGCGTPAVASGPPPCTNCGPGAPAGAVIPPPPAPVGGAPSGPFGP